MTDTLTSQDGRFRLLMQNDGNLVVYGGGVAREVPGMGIVIAPPAPPPQPQAQVVRGRLRVDGRRLLYDDGTPFRWRGVTAFRLLEMVAHGRESEASAFFRWAHSSGFSVVRVLSMCAGMFPLTPEDGITHIPRLCELAREHDLYLHVVALADTASPIAQYMSHGSYVESLSARVEIGPVALFEIANEPYHPTHDPRVHEVANLKAWAARVPAWMPMALGAAAEDESREMASAPVIVAHLDRGRDGWNMVRRVRELENLSNLTGRYVINSEPIGAAEANEPGRRNANPSIHFTFGALSRIFGVGSTFHCEDGLHARVPGPVQLQQACAEAFIAGTRIVPDSAELTFKNAGWPDSPVASVRFAEGPPKPDACVRAYSGIQGNAGVLVLVGVQGDPGVVYGTGWAPGGVIADRPGVRVLDIHKA